ncbi:NUDIX domain-containing protein [uncultured Lacinutrix sp.]|uniref:NUDIX hydrolase n=1 Tax=uncultured Lacinutrix sp. TaxID=574032 RepID=UPI0026379D11|nr:NUDIX domain-containing protein [uncultured Lacinutrix sp.]
MHYIFVNDKPIILTTKVEKETNFKNFLLKDVSIDTIIKTISKRKIESVRLIHHNPNTILKKFLAKLPNVVAGGGKVFNNKGDVLFIFRNNKWDLPKGKSEGKESIEETAIREVEEETGVNGLKINKPLETTYHIFKRNDKLKIKITYWFEMNTNFEGELFPQENEGITKVAWLNKEEATKALKNSYANIKLLI